MGLLDSLFGKKREVGMSFDIEDLDLFINTSKRVHMKRLAIEIVTSYLGRSVSQTEFRVKSKGEYVKDEMYYRLNVRPNKNMTATRFWQIVMKKLVYDGEVLIIQADDEDLLIADNYDHVEYAVYDDVFKNVWVRGFEFKRTFTQQEVIHLRYGNERLAPLIDGLFADYGDLFGFIVHGQKVKNQIRGTVDMDMIGAKSKEHQEKLQSFITNMYKAIEEKPVAIVPQQPGIEYNEVSGKGGSQSVDDIDKITNGFLSEIAKVLGVPMPLLRGDMADTGEILKNYMFNTVSPIVQQIGNELNHKFITKSDYLNGDGVVIRKPMYRDIFELSTSIDKLISSGVFNGDEIRTLAGYDTTGEEIHSTYFITKNFQSGDEATNGERGDTSANEKQTKND